MGSDVKGMRKESSGVYGMDTAEEVAFWTKRGRGADKQKSRLTETTYSSQSCPENAAELTVRTTRCTLSDPFCMRRNSPDPRSVSSRSFSFVRCCFFVLPVSQVPYSSLLPLIARLP